MSDLMLLLPADSIEAPPGAHDPGLLPVPSGLARRLAGAGPAAAARPDEPPEDSPVWRGLAAFVLLADTYPAGQLSLTVCKPSDSPLAASIMERSGLAAITLVFWERDQRRVVLGTADPASVIRPAAQPPTLVGLLPREVSWYSEGSFSDPIPCLDSHQRALLLRRLSRFTSQAASAFRRDLSTAGEAILRSALEGEDAPCWRTRVEAVVTLDGLPSFQALTRQSLPCRVGRNPLMAALGCEDDPEQSMDRTLWQWRGIPIAVTSAAIGLEPPAGSAAAQEALEELSGEMAMLRHLSPSFLTSAARKMADWAEQQRGTMREEAMEAVQQWVQELGALAALPHDPPVIACPPDATSPTLQTVLKEALEDDLAEAAFHLFTDTLTILPAAQLGETMLDAIFTVRMDGETRTVLPPLSREAAMYIARRGLGDSGFQPALARVSAAPSGDVEVVFALKNRQTVCFSRTYTPGEQLRLTEIPSVSVWPGQPFHPEHWHLHFLSLAGDIRVQTLVQGQWKEYPAGEAGDPPAVYRLNACPAVLSVFREEQCLGALLNLAAVPAEAPAGEAVGALDATGASVHLALSVGGEARPLALPSLWHVMLRGPSGYEQERLPVWPLGPDFPASVQRWNENDEPFPWVDGCLSDGEDALGCLLTRTDTPGRAARRLLLRASLVCLSLGAVLRNADHLDVRLVLPPALLPLDAQRLTEEFVALASGLSRDTGMPVRVKQPTAGLLLSATHYLRLPFQGQSFCLLYAGGRHSGLSVWLRGMERPSLTLPLCGGLTSLLTRCVSADPGLLEAAPGFSPERTALPALKEQLRLTLSLARTASGTQTAGDRFQAALDRLMILDPGAFLSSSPDPSRPSQTTPTPEDLLLYSLALRLTAAGLALEKLRWDSALSIHLPGQMPLILGDQAALLFPRLDERSVWQLSGFPQVAMGEGNPVSACLITLSPEPGREACLGAVMAAGPLPGATLSHLNGVERPNELASRFLYCFRQAFPEAAQRLLPGLFTQDGLPVPSVLNYLAETANRKQDSDADYFIKILEQLVLDLRSGK